MNLFTQQFIPHDVPPKAVRSRGFCWFSIIDLLLGGVSISVSQVLCLCHGYCDTHAYLNAIVAAELASHGYAVVTVDYEVSRISSSPTSCFLRICVVCVVPSLLSGNICL